MFAEESSYPTSNLHLPPINKSFRQRIRPPPTPSFPSRAAKAAHIAENVIALKAKYNDYTAWLKNPPRQHYHREPQQAQDLLKTSLCRMGIDTTHAEQLVSKCSWYVYQFEKALEINPEQRKQLISNSKKKKHRNLESSSITINSSDHDESFVSHSRSNQSGLPSIYVTDTTTSSSRHRKVDFGREQVRNIRRTPSQSPANKPRLKPMDSFNSSIDLDASLTSQNLRRTTRTRSILRKQNSSSSMNTSTDISQRKGTNQNLTPLSTIITDGIPLGTRSQRLFGGSECFAQIMNELEHQQHVDF